jgi:hypothetical protein
MFRVRERPNQSKPRLAPPLLGHHVPGSLGLRSELKRIAAALPSSIA